MDFGLLVQDLSKNIMLKLILICIKQRGIRIEKVAYISILKGNSLPLYVNQTSLPQKMPCTSVNIVINSGWYTIGHDCLLKLRYLPASQFLWPVLISFKTKNNHWSFMSYGQAFLFKIIIIWLKKDWYVFRIWTTYP